MTHRDRVLVDVAPAALIRIVAFAVGLWFLWYVRDVLLLLLVSVLLASALEPIAGSLQRFRFPRALSVSIVYVVGVVMIGSIGLILVPPLIDDIRALALELPAAYLRFGDFFGHTSEFLGTPQAISSLQDGLVSFGNFLARSSGGFFVTTKNIFGSVFAALLTFVISFYLVVSRNSLVLFVRSLVPARHQSYILDLVERAQKKIGRWVLAEIVLGAIVGTLTFIGLWSLGVPYALALALLAGFLELIPVLGPILAGIPAVLLGFTQSPLTGALVLILVVVIQQVENHLLVPTIMRRVIGLNPLTTILAMIVGAKLAGFLGLFLAVPVATIIVVFLSDLVPAGKEGEELPA